MMENKKSIVTSKMAKNASLSDNGLKMVKLLINSNDPELTLIAKLITTEKDYQNLKTILNIWDQESTKSCFL